MNLSPRHIFHHAMMAGVLFISALATTSCSDELPEVKPNFSVSGADTQISLNISLPQMEVKSRSELTADQSNLVESLWVGIYSAVDGSALCDPIIQENDVQTENHQSYKLENIKTKSGYAYIVAVANIDHKGCKYNADGSYTQGTLRELLATANTWDDFCAISVLAPEFAGNPAVTTPVTNTLPMSGVYYSSDNDPTLNTWTDLSTKSVFIPISSKAYELPGRIHLRRQISHITFNLIPTKDVTITPNSYQIVNAPRTAWILERDETVNEGKINASFLKTNSTQMRVTSQETVKDGFFNSDNMGSRFFSAGETNGSYTFDFFQFENKHKGEASDYHDREKEVKGTDNLNTGIYKALCPAGSWTYNNTATYVIINCRVSPGNLDSNLEGINTDAIMTYGDAKIVVHLGGINNIWSDFNCNRNTKYTYNVTVGGVNDIAVEAIEDKETIPGFEGIVTQITGGYFNLDCHYNRFNVSLSDNERMGAGFGYIIEAYDDNGAHIQFDENSVDKFDTKYSDWVIFVPTTGEDEYAEFPKPNDNSRHLRISLKEMGMTEKKGNETVLSYPHTDKKGGADSPRWYTVFVNEYVYEESSDETKGNWKNYVNLPDRRCWIKVTKKESSDKESVLVSSKYAISQKSIQTYYNTEITANIGAVGLEHQNESRGLVLKSLYGPSEKGTLNMNNGRLNTWDYINHTHTYSGYNGTQSKEWGSIVDQTAPQLINEITAQGASYPAKLKQSELNGNFENFVPLPKMLNNLGIDVSALTWVPESGRQHITLTAAIGAPQNISSGRSDQIIEAIAACMNRNRDNNGDGIISKDEIRWYVPATGKYLRMILGRRSLNTPLMDYDAVGTALFYPTNRNQTEPYSKNSNTRWKLFSSTRHVVWAYEGLSFSDLKLQGSIGYWEVRCVRNLGTNLSEIGSENSDGTQMAFTHDGDATNGGTVTMTYYDSESVRAPHSGAFPIHPINDQQYNRCAYSFEFAPLQGNTADNQNFQYSGASDQNSINTWIAGNPCKNLNTNDHNGWRVPNQKELSIMRNLGLFNNMTSDQRYILSCTRELYDLGGIRINGTGNFSGCRLLSVCKVSTTAFYIGNTAIVRCVRDKETIR